MEYKKIFDVIVDIRQESLTYGQWFGLTLSAENKQALYIPQGFAHGFQTLCDDTEVCYLMGEYYYPDAARGIRWDSPTLAICWPKTSVIISERDKIFPEWLP